MTTPRFIAFAILLFIANFFVCSSYAEIISWVDKNGVRHFCNTGGPEKGKQTDVAGEYTSGQSEQRNDSKRNLTNVLKMYEKERKEYKKKREKARQDRYKKKAEESEKAQREKMEALGKKIRDDHLKNKKIIDDLEASRRLNEKLQRDYYRYGGR